MPIVGRFGTQAREAEAAAPPSNVIESAAAGPSPADEYLDQFHEMIAMLALIDRKPELADVIRDWRPRSYAESFAGAPRENGEVFRRLDGRNRLLHGAFEAVATSLDRLADWAVDFCGRDRPLQRAQDRNACAALGRSMRQLLGRASSLVAFADAHRRGAPKKPGMEANRRSRGIEN